MSSLGFEHPTDGTPHTHELAFETDKTDFTATAGLQASSAGKKTGYFHELSPPTLTCPTLKCTN